MPAKSGAQAKFDHVDDTGDLVFYCGASAFHVQVDDNLEHAILEAKQVRQEAYDAMPTHETKTLPISKIQALIRAGADSENVAEQYGLSAALVRRFTSSVQMEKQDAIEQFLAVNAPKGSRMHTIGDLIDLTLTAAKVDSQSVKWSATRQGREPWRIIAQFKTPHNSVQAVWTWSIRDNSIECMNSAAKVLLGETVDVPSTTMPTPQSDRVSQAPSAQRAYDPLPPYQPYADDNGESTSRKPAQGSTSYEPQRQHQATMRDSQATFPRQTEGSAARSQGQDPALVPPNQYGRQETQPVNVFAPTMPYNDDDGYVQSAHADSETRNTQAMNHTVRQPGRAGQEGIWTGETTDTARESHGLRGQESTTNTPETARDKQGTKHTPTKHEKKTQTNGKRKGNRSTMPSWDEIIFGD